MGRLIVTGAAALLLGGCEMSVKTDAADGGNGTGELSVKAPGVGLNIDLPAMVKAEIDGGGDLIFPGSTMNGLNLNASAGTGAGNQGNVQLKFETPAAVREVLAWYQDPARAPAMTGISVQQVGTGGYRISGQAQEGGDPFNVELAPKAGGGTQAKLNLGKAG
jgi:hypothetical protein